MTGQWVRWSLLVYPASATTQEASCYSPSIISWEVGEPSRWGLWSQPANCSDITCWLLGLNQISELQSLHLGFVSFTASHFPAASTSPTGRLWAPSPVNRRTTVTRLIAVTGLLLASLIVIHDVQMHMAFCPLSHPEPPTNHNMK